jgi:hypothetical protein
MWQVPLLFGGKIAAADTFIYISYKSENSRPCRGQFNRQTWKATSHYSCGHFVGTLFFKEKKCVR